MAITGVFRKTVDLDHGVRMTPLGQLFATTDHNAQTFEVELKASGKDYNVSGAGVFGYFIRADENTVVIAGKASGNVVTLTLPESCYASVGHFSLIIKVSSGDDRKAVFWGDGFVTRSSTDVIVDPGDVVPSLEELLARIAEMKEGTRAANDAADRANTAAQQAGAARDAANTAASAANTAAAQANAARDAANTAANAANAATSQANAARDAANAAAKSANDAADRVDTSIAGAQKAAQAANTAASAANTATSQAGAARDAANAAAKSANDAANAANDAARIAGKWADVEVTVEMKETDFSPVCTVTDGERGGKRMAFELPIGPTGLTPEIAVGNVTTGLPGTDAAVSLSGTKENPVLDFVIPRGDTGAVEGLAYGDTNPLALGEASPGTSDEVSRKDHVHPMPGAEDVGALPITGGTLSGDITVSKSDASARVRVKNENTGKEIGLVSDHTNVVGIWDYTPEKSGWLVYKNDSGAGINGSATSLSATHYIFGRPFNGTQDVSGGITNASHIELSGTTPFIDFHYDNSTKDYTSRIIASAEDTLTITGKLNVTDSLTGNARAELLKAVYPVGAIYMSIVSTSPASLFGGSWEPLPAGRFLRSAGTASGLTFTAGTSGGAGIEATDGITSDVISRAATDGTSLNATQMPSHNHMVALGQSGVAGKPDSGPYTLPQFTAMVGSYVNPAATGNAVASLSVGSGGAHTHTFDHKHSTKVPPYYVVYMWRRTA